MACRCAPALDQLRKEIDTAWPNRDRASDGCCGDAAHAARTSDHNPDSSGFAHARDFDENIAPNLGDKPLLFLIPKLLADPRTKYLIYERLIYYPGSVPRKYSGINAHDHHLHVSIKPDATHDTRQWFATSPHTTATPPEEDDLPFTEAQVRQMIVEEVVKVLRSEGLSQEAAEDDTEQTSLVNTGRILRRQNRVIGKAAGVADVDMAAAERL